MSSERIRSLRRVAVTGIGAICGLGHNVKDIWARAVEGRSGVSSLSNIETNDLPVKFGGEVKNFTISPDLIPEKEQKKFDKFVHYAVHSCEEAIKDAQIIESNFFMLDRVGVIIGVGMGGFPIIEQTSTAYLNGGSRKVSPFFIPSVIPNMTSGYISIKYGLKGANYSISSACASSGHAIMAAAHEIMLGNHDVMITGGAEAVLTYLPISGFANMKAISKRNEEPEKASRPFDLDRDGFVMGEGAGIIVLEDMEKAILRGANIYAELVGMAATSDAHHITAPHPEGEGAINCMSLALYNADLQAKKIDYINAHGTATPLGDIAETNAIKKVFENHAHKLSISATKSMTGHLLGAAGALESIFCLMSIKDGIIPPTINLDKEDPKCDLNYVPNKAIKKDITYALNNSFGFGGTNSCLIFKKC
ncbi:MAG: beta-ketoacyl-ACP synthase II [Oligoflexia bacterium]|nr:beta-ketoacyl-ACP synthase II [Oligoflexia bacterium]